MHGGGCISACNDYVLFKLFLSFGVLLSRSTFFTMHAQKWLSPFSIACCGFQIYIYDITVFILSLSSSILASVYFLITEILLIITIKFKINILKEFLKN